tara:strand:+ start:651 stop:782 length:132 start_codon:yes stop_codon:yes gene_type:complete
LRECFDFGKDLAYIKKFEAVNDSDTFDHVKELCLTKDSFKNEW